MTWKAIYKHDQDGAPHASTPHGKSTLKKHVKEGKPIRLMIGDDSTDQIIVTSPVVLILKADEVFAQVEWEATEFPKVGGPEMGSFLAPHHRYLVNLSTSGRHQRLAIYEDLPGGTPQAARTEDQRYGLTWLGDV